MAKRIEKQAAKTKQAGKQTGKHTDGSKDGERKSKVGSDRAAAKHFGGGGDFGIPAEGAGRFTEVAEEAKYQPGGDHHSDPRPPRSGGAGNRESGVGGVDAGPGSSSGGDLDMDLIGVGTHGSGVSASGPDDRQRGADMSHARTARQVDHAHEPRKKKIRGTSMDRTGDKLGDSSGGASTSSGLGTGSGSVNPTETGDDAAAGEISQGEAGGDDNTDIDNLS